LLKIELVIDAFSVYRSLQWQIHIVGYVTFSMVSTLGEGLRELLHGPGGFVGQRDNDNGQAQITRLARAVGTCEACRFLCPPAAIFFLSTYPWATFLTTFLSDAMMGFSNSPYLWHDTIEAT
jgi:hypothetical protein